MPTASVTHNVVQATTPENRVEVNVLNYYDPTSKENTGVAQSLITAHEAASDPHPQYATEDWVVANIPLSPKLQKKLVVTVGGIGSGENFEGETWDTIKAAYDSLSEGQMVLVKNKGSDYIVYRRAVATATVSGGVITAITLNYAGYGYTSAPTITITGGGGTGATAIANMDVASNGGKIISFTVTNPGTGYSTAPTVTVANTTQNNTFGGIRFINTRLEAYSGRDSIKKAGAVTLNNTVEFCGIRNKTMGSLAQYYKEYGQLNTLSLPAYPDNASAISGGLSVGDIYKTATGELRIRV
jgi:hypothetical protein